MLTNRRNNIPAGLFLLVQIAMVAPFIAGCGSSGPQYHPVSGTVIFESDGSKAQFGSIEFRSETDPPIIARGRVAKDGTFQLSSVGKDGTVAGWHTVVIQQVVGNPRGGDVVHHHGLEVSLKYNDHRSTDLRVEVKKDNDNQLELTVQEK